jgi:hypothetical protein
MLKNSLISAYFPIYIIFLLPLEIIVFEVRVNFNCLLQRISKIIPIF